MMSRCIKALSELPSFHNLPRPRQYHLCLLQGSREVLKQPSLIAFTEWEIRWATSHLSRAQMLSKLVWLLLLQSMRKRRRTIKNRKESHPRTVTALLLQCPRKKELIRSSRNSSTPTSINTDQWKWLRAKKLDSCTRLLCHLISQDKKKSEGCSAKSLLIDKCTRGRIKSDFIVSIGSESYQISK